MQRTKSTSEARPENALPIELLRERQWLEKLSRQLVSDESLAQDLVQDTWLSALGRRPTEVSRPRAWLHSVFFNRLRMHRRRERLRVAQAHPVEPASGASEPSVVSEERGLIDVLAAHIARLDEPYRSTLILHNYEGLSCAAISRRDKLPAGAVRWRLKKDLDVLRSRLGLRRSGRVFEASFSRHSSEEDARGAARGPFLRTGVGPSRSGRQSVGSRSHWSSQPRQS